MDLTCTCGRGYDTVLARPVGKTGSIEKCAPCLVDAGHTIIIG